MGRLRGALRVRGPKRFRRRMHWNLVYGGGGCVVVGLAALFLTKAPRSAGVLAIGAFALAFGLACTITGVVG